MLALLPLLLACSSPPPPAPIGPWSLSPWSGAGQTRVLVDVAHSGIGDPLEVWDGHEFGLGNAMSTQPLLSRLSAMDVRHRTLRGGPLDADVLHEADVLWLSVPRSLSAREIEAVQTWVEAGGALMLIAETDNAWGHTDDLARLLRPWGIEPVGNTARELELVDGVVQGIPGPPGVYRDGEPPLTLDRARRMPLVRSFTEHPVTAGVRLVAMDGAAVIGKDLPDGAGIGLLSAEAGYADLGDAPGDARSNGRRTMDEPQGGGLAVIAALQPGEGRVVVLGDAAVTGAAWLGMADNERLALNAVQWLSGRESETPWRDRPPSTVVLGFEQERTGWTAGLRDAQGFHHLFADLSREPSLTVRALPDHADPVDVLGFLEPRLPYSDAELAALRTRLEGGQRMLLVTNIARPGIGSAQLLASLLPDEAIEGTGRLPLRDLNPDDAKEVVKPVLDTWGTLAAAEGYPTRTDRIAALTHPFENYKGRRGEDVKPKRYSKGSPYLFDVRISGGEPVLQATLPGGQTVDILRRYPVGDGELLVMLQGEIWGGRTLPTVREAPVDLNQPAYDSVLDFAAWLAESPQ